MIKTSTQINTNDTLINQHTPQEPNHTNLHNRVSELEKNNKILLSEITKLKNERSTLKSESALALLKVEESCEILLEQLHRTQEQLERKTLDNKLALSKLSLYKDNFTNLINEHVEHWHFTELKTTILSKDDEPLTIAWQFSNVYVNNQIFPTLNFKTTIQGGVAGIIFPQQNEHSLYPLLQRWPRPWAEAPELCCLPVQGSYNQGSNAILSSLSTSDWRMLQDLTACLLKLLSEKNSRLTLDEGILVTIRGALENLKFSLGHWPKIFRYDAINIAGYMKLENFHSMEISLSNPQIGERLIGDFSYKISTVHAPGEPIDQHPRLEFPESSRNALQNWYVESEDDRGARLELRFAKPGAMDTEVWNQLSENDQILIAGLLGSSSTQFADLKLNDMQDIPPKEYWKAACETMRRILANLATYKRPAISR